MVNINKVLISIFIFLMMHCAQRKVYKKWRWAKIENYPPCQRHFLYTMLWDRTQPPDLNPSVHPNPSGLKGLCRISPISVCNPPRVRSDKKKLSTDEWGELENFQFQRLFNPFFSAFWKFFLLKWNSLKFSSVTTSSCLVATLSCCSNRISKASFSCSAENNRLIWW